MKKSKNILHVVNIFFVLPYFIGSQFKYLNKRGFKQHVICSPSHHLHEYSKEMGFQYQEIEILRAIHLLKDIKSIIQIVRYIKKNKIDTVVGHTPKGALLAMIAGFIMRVPKRIYFRHGLVHETMVGFKRWLMINIDRLTALFATKVVCVSPSLFQKSLDYKLNNSSKQIVLGKGTCGGIDAKNKFNPLMIDSAKQNDLQKKLDIHKDDYIIGFCGRLVRDKGIIELVEAFVDIQKRTKRKLKLLLVGDFEERDKLPFNIQETISNHPDIIITGFIFDSIEYYYSLMNIFVLPSYREGFPTSVLEASAMNIPVLTTTVTGCIDSIIEGETGFYISHTSEDISSKIMGLINSTSTKSNEIVENGRKFVLKNFDNQILWPIIEKELYNN